jgi:hypothetical protein
VIERLLLPLAMLVTALVAGLVMVVSHSPASQTVTTAAGATQATSDGPPTCCTG